MRQRFFIMLTAASTCLAVFALTATASAAEVASAASPIADSQPLQAAPVLWGEPSTLAMAAAACGLLMLVRRPRTQQR